MTSPRFALAASLLLITALPPITAAQYGRGGGGRESGGYREGRDLGPPPPPLPGAEIDGPPDSAAMRSMFALSDSQTVRYAALYDSLLVSTRPQRDSVRAATDRMHTRLDSGDRAAANFYAELLMDLAKELKASQDKFDDRLRGLLSRDQLKAYRRWEDGAERAAQARNREEGLRWSAPMVYGGRSAGGSEDRRSTVRAADAPAPDLGAQAVRVGRTVYVAAQTALDSAGIVQGADLRTQAAQAFKNLTAVLRKSGATPAFAP